MNDFEEYIPAINSVVKILKQSKSLLFITGAGISADSGLPTYRGIGGLYNCNTNEGLPIEKLLSGETMQKSPELTWKYLSQIEQASRGSSGLDSWPWHQKPGRAIGIRAGPGAAPSCLSWSSCFSRRRQSPRTVPKRPRHRSRLPSTE